MIHHRLCNAKPNFYPRSPCGERHEKEANNQPEQQISIHALLAESDERANSFPHAPPQISIHALLAESDKPVKVGKNLMDNFYPRSPCGERRLNLPSSPIDKNISIHALLAESDSRAANCQQRSHQISIHALLAESDAYIMTTTICTASFLSTLSLRRATVVSTVKLASPVLFLSTLSLRRATTDMRQRLI